MSLKLVGSHVDDDLTLVYDLCCDRNVPAQCEWTGVVNLMPVKGKSIELSATFHCKEMFDIIGFAVIKVEQDSKTETVAVKETIKKESVPSDSSGSMTIPDISTISSRTSTVK